MTKPTIYIETTVIGHLAARLQPDPVVAGRQIVTREWWKTAPDRFRLIVSQLVAEECAAGDEEAAAERLSFIKELEVVKAREAAMVLATKLHFTSAIPQSEPRDALHIAIAATNGIEYLVTWNFKHIANVTTRGVIERTCRVFGYEPPRICTPNELLEA
jgi:predicted nucleic acid-binding protein